MKILIDDADLNKVARLFDILPLDGVTTNPTILAEQGGDPIELLHQLKELLPAGGDLHTQVIGTDPDTMVNEARFLCKELGSELYVKIPVTAAGYQAMRRLAAEGVRVTATAIYSPMQAFLAAKAGAAYVAPYVNRLDNMGANGVEIAIAIQQMFDANHLETQLLAASFKNSAQIQALAEVGAGAITAAPDVLINLFKSPATDAAVAEQRRDLESVIGEGNNFTNFRFAGLEAK